MTAETTAVPPAEPDPPVDGEQPGRPRTAVGGPAGARARCLLAANPNEMTLDGTNTWILAEPGARQAVVVDPGPDDEAHLAAVLAEVERIGCTVALTVLTHRHADHTAGAPRFAELTGAPVRAASPDLLIDGDMLVDGEEIGVDGLALTVLATPGHTDDSLCLLLPADRALLSGDTVLGRGTTIIAHPDGRLGDYLDSLRRLRRLGAEGGYRTVLPGHGPVLTDGLGGVDYYLAHRASRLAQVETAVEAGHRTAEAVVAAVYAQTPRDLWPAATLSVRAQLDYLREHGLI